MTDPDFPEHEYLTVRELAGLLRLKERKVYDLAASGAVPCSRATGKLLFPAAGIRAWIAAAQSGGPQQGEPQPGGPQPGGTARMDAAPRPPILLGSHDPLLDWAIRQSRCGLATFFDGSLDGLDRFVRGEGVAAGLHIQDAATGAWNRPAVARAAAACDAALVTFATRTRGIVHGLPGETAPARLSDLAGLRVVPRQPESGTEGLFRDLAAQAGLDLATITLVETARTEDEAAGAVRRGAADAAFGLEAAARAYGLPFVPIVQERFALLVDRKAWFDPPMQALLTFCAGAAFARHAAELGGYDISDLSRVDWNA